MDGRWRYARGTDARPRLGGPHRVPLPAAARQSRRRGRLRQRCDGCLCRGRPVRVAVVVHRAAGPRDLGTLPVVAALRADPVDVRAVRRVGQDVGGGAVGPARRAGAAHRSDTAVLVVVRDDRRGRGHSSHRGVRRLPGDRIAVLLLGLRRAGRHGAAVVRSGSPVGPGHRSARHPQRTGGSGRHSGAPEGLEPPARRHR